MADDAEPDFKEAAIYQVPTGLAGKPEYVASCARDLCGYFGECSATTGIMVHSLPYGHKVSLERLCDKAHVKNYERRGEDFTHYTFSTVLKKQ